MTLEDIIENIKLLTVKVKTDKESGTGVLVIQNNKAYVLTVYHCIYGKKEPYHTVDVDNVIFKFNSKVTTKDIKPLNIEGYKENIVLLEVDITKLKIDGIKELLLLDRVFYDKQYHLRGYPKTLSYANPFKAKCNDKDLDKITFSIRVDGLTEDTSGDDAIDFIAGLSGSGVFFSENNQLYLVGLVNTLATDKGVFNLAYCTKLIDLKDTSIKLSKLLVFTDYARNMERTETNNLHYVNQLIEAYDSESNTSINKIEDVRKPKYKRHLENARKSFHKIEILRRFTRDISMEDEYENFQEDIYQGIINTVDNDYENMFKKVKATEDEATNMSTEFYPLEDRKCEKIEKKGVCHHLIEDKKISWLEDE